jgi:hypothetical protein
MWTYVPNQEFEPNEKIPIRFALQQYRKKALDQIHMIM